MKTGARSVSRCRILRPSATDRRAYRVSQLLPSRTACLSVQYVKSPGIPGFILALEAYHYHLFDDNEITLATAQGRPHGGSGFRDVAMESERTLILAVRVCCVRDSYPRSVVPDKCGHIS